MKNALGQTINDTIVEAYAILGLDVDTFDEMRDGVMLYSAARRLGVHMSGNNELMDAIRKNKDVFLAALNAKYFQ